MKTIRSENMWMRLGSMWIAGLVILSCMGLQFQSPSGGRCSRKLRRVLCPHKGRGRDGDFRSNFSVELFVGCIPVAIGNLVRVKGVPLGYVLAFYHWGMYGVLLGTNSFVIPGPGRFLPSLTTLFYGSGIYEISSYTLISSATFSLHDRYGDSTSYGASVRKHKWGALRLSKTELVVIAFAILILAISNYYEAWYIFHM